MSLVLKKLYLAVLVIAGLAGINDGISITHADEPREMERISLSRTAASGDVVSGILSKNIYRYEDQVVKVPYQVPYQVEVPYTERIPYTVEVPYTDYEDYTEPVQHCGYVPVQDCRTVPRCTIQRQCGSTPGACRDVSDRVCRRDRQGRESCSNVTRRQCDPPRQSCQDRQVCHNDQICNTRNEYRCRTDYVRRTRPVTRYRTETRYREEQRTRTETRYRTEYRDEVRSVPVFVRQWTLPVQIQFPSEARLQAGEQELIQVVLSGEESNPSVSVSIESRYLNYQITKQERKEGGAIVHVKLIAKYTTSDVGVVSTIQKLRVEVQKESKAASVRFTDSARYPRIQTQYRIQIRDLDLGRVVFENEQTRGAGMDELFIPVTEKLQLDHDFVLSLQVIREGIVIEGGRVQFETTESIRSLIDYSRMADPSQVRNLKISGSLSDTLIQFEDSASDHAKVKTKYRVILKRPKMFLFIRTGWEILGQGEFTKTDIRPGDLGISSEVIADYLEPEDRVVVELQTIRSSERFPGGRDIVLPTQELDIELK